MAYDYTKKTKATIISEKISHLYNRAQQSHYDVSSWEQSVQELIQQPSLNQEIRDTYETVLVLFPTAATVWTRYAELEMNELEMNERYKNEANVKVGTAAIKHIFSRCLLNCPWLPLWSMYLKFIKRVNESKGAEGLPEVRNAYEFTLDQLGQDVNAGTLWLEYVSLLASPQPGSAAYAALYPNVVVGQEESARTTVVRRAYHRALVVPCQSLDVLWRQYEAFEKSNSSEQFARKIVEDCRPRMLAAKNFLKERLARLKPINMTRLAVPPGKGGLGQEEQMRFWREYLAWERSNPQRLDPATASARIVLAYDQCLMAAWHYPDIWFEYSRWHADSAGAASVQSAVAVLMRAQKALPTCILLRFVLADLEESQGKEGVERAKQVYDGLIAQIEAEGSKPEASGPPELPGPALRLPPDQGGLVWVQYMRFLRRTAGEAESRRLFLRAKKWPLCPWQVYVAMALSEYHHHKEPTVARRIFEKGLEDPRMLTCSNYIVAYHQFLMSIGDVDNARALFERVLTEDANRKSVEIWGAYTGFEYDMGGLTPALAVETRAREALGPGVRVGLGLALARYTVDNLWPVATDQRKHLERVMGLAPPVAPPPPADEDGGDGGFRWKEEEETAYPQGDADAENGREKISVVDRFINEITSLPVEPPLPDVDRVIEILITTDLSEAAIAAGCAEPDVNGPLSAAQHALTGPSAPAQPPLGYNDGSGGGGGGYQTYTGGTGATPPHMAFKEEDLVMERMGVNMKRAFEGYNGGDGEEEEDGNPFAGAGSQVRDLYRMRIKQRTRIVGADG